MELETHNVMAELTVSGTLSGIHRYTFHNSSQGDDNIILVRYLTNQQGKARAHSG